MVKRSVVAPMSLITPGGTVPGHQKMPGTRMPPSHVVPLPWRNIPALPPCCR